MFEPRSGAEGHVGHLCDTRLGSAISAVNLAHNERAGHAHGRQDLFQARTLHRLPPEGYEDLDVDPQQPGPKGLARPAPPTRAPSLLARLQLLKPGVKGFAAFLTGLRPPMIEEENG